MSKKIDAVGMACPMPVIMVKKELDAGETFIVIKVDNKIAVENLKKLGNNQGCEISVKEEADNYLVSFTKGDVQQEDLAQENKLVPISKDYTIFIGKDYIGEGDHTLGRSLMQMMFYTLTQSDDLPKSILFMNAGVKLAVEDEQSIEHINTLAGLGVEILVCGACLNFYEMADQLKAGSISNMYEILGRMQQASKVITV